MYSTREQIYVELLDMAKLISGSDSATARSIGVTKQKVCDWRNNRVAMPQHHIICLARLSKTVAGFWLEMIALDKVNIKARQKNLKQQITTGDVAEATRALLLRN